MLVLVQADAMLSNAWLNVATQGGWTDPGFLEVGNDPQLFGLAASRAQFAQWCLIKTALLLSMDLAKANATDPYIALLKNPELISINQDSLAHIGRLVASATPSSDTASATIAGAVRLPPPVTHATEENPDIARHATGETVQITDCQLNPAAVTAAQQWHVTNETLSQAGKCLTLTGTGGVALQTSRMLNTGGA